MVLAAEQDSGEAADGDEAGDDGANAAPEAVSGNRRIARRARRLTSTRRLTLVSSLQAAGRQLS